jgi:WD40 repeat protein
MPDAKDIAKLYEPKTSTIITAEPQVSLARFSPCGKLLVGGGYDARVRRWNVAAEGMPELPALEGHHGWVEGLAFRAEGELLFTADSWGQICCWSGYTEDKPAVKWKLDQAHDGWVRTLAVNPDGKSVASCASDRFIRIWSAEDGAKQFEFPQSEFGNLCLKYAPDGTLLTGDDRGIVRHWKADGTLIRQFDASSLYVLSRLQDVGGVFALALDKEAKTLAVGGTKPVNGGTVVGVPTILLFDLATGEQKQKYDLGTQNDCYVADLQFHDDDFLSAVTYGTPGSGQLIYLKAEEKAPLLTYKQMQNCHSLSWHPDGKRLAVAATNGGSNGNGRPVDKEGKYKGNNSPIHVFTFST